MIGDSSQIKTRILDFSGTHHVVEDRVYFWENEQWYYVLDDLRYDGGMRVECDSAYANYALFDD